MANNVVTLTGADQKRINEILEELKEIYNAESVGLVKEEWGYTIRLYNCPEIYAKV